MNTTAERAAELRVAEAIGRRIKAVRALRKVSQARLEEITRIPLGSLRAYEQGKTVPPIDRLITIATALEIEPSELIPGSVKR